MRVAILFLAFFIYSPLHAAHIIGGDISYTCTGFGEYEFTMNVYRDCNSEAVFDSEPDGLVANATIFLNSTLVSTIDLDAPMISTVNQINSAHPCPQDLDLCIEKGTYIFLLELPESTGEYTISYQRCCRTSTINNIWIPSSTGLTLTIDIGEQAQELCNNSPVFKNEFEPLICSAESFTMDLSASDEDGDELRYFFTAPFMGGGLAGSGSNWGLISDINGVAPDPDAPPPYADVNFASPTFTSQAPFGGDPIITIDSLTGIISGTPEILGQFVLAIAVEEYREGSLLSTVQRDIQINVVNCDETLCQTTSTSNQNNSNKQLTFHPNPSTGIFSIEQIEFNIESYKVYDLYGKVLIQDQNNLEQIDLSNYSAGIYIVQVLSTKGELLSGKVIKH